MMVWEQNYRARRIIEKQMADGMMQGQRTQNKRWIVQSLLAERLTVLEWVSFLLVVDLRPRAHIVRFLGDSLQAKLGCIAELERLIVLYQLMLLSLQFLYLKLAETRTNKYFWLELLPKDTAILGQLILGLRPLLLPLDEKRPLGRQFQRGRIALLLFSLLPLHNALIVTDGGSISTLIPEIEMRHPFHLHLPTFFDQACLTIRSVDLQTVVFTLAVQQLLSKGQLKVFRRNGEDGMLRVLIRFILPEYQLRLFLPEVSLSIAQEAKLHLILFFVYILLQLFLKVVIVIMDGHCVSLLFH